MRNPGSRLESFPGGFNTRYAAILFTGAALLLSACGKNDRPQPKIDNVWNAGIITDIDPLKGRSKKLVEVTIASCVREDGLLKIASDTEIDEITNGIDGSVIGDLDSEGTEDGADILANSELIPRNVYSEGSAYITNAMDETERIACKNSFPVSEAQYSHAQIGDPTAAPRLDK